MDTHVLKVEGKKTRTNRDLYYVSLGDGNDYSTFEFAIASKAQQLMGQPVTARVSFKDQYKNLEDIAAQGQLAPLALPGGTPLGGVPSQSTFGPPAVMSSANNGSIPMQGDKQESINTQSAIKQATTLVASLFQGAGPEAAPEARELVKEIAREYFAIFSGAPSSAPQTVDQVAATVNAEMPGAVAVGAMENAPQW